MRELHSKRGTATYKTLEVFGPEHEFSIVNNEMRALPIADKIIKELHGRIVNSVEFPMFTLGKELQMHVMEVRPNAPFASPIEFEETMQDAVLFLSEHVERRYQGRLLGTGMHPLLGLDETWVWPHRHRQIYDAYRQVFSLRRHGWLNIQSFQLNLPYAKEEEGVRLYNLLAEVCGYLPAIAASSPICEGKLGQFVDNRLRFYAENQSEIPSIVGNVIPEYVSTFDQYRLGIIGKYSVDLKAAGAGKPILGKEWVNSRGVIFRFDRRAVEIRVMDEQDCVKSDVALSCFVRALLRGLMAEESKLAPQEVLVKDYNEIIRNGLDAKTLSVRGLNARQVCRELLKIAQKNATDEELGYLSLVRRRIETGNLSETIRERIQNSSRKIDFSEALIQVYSKLMESLIDNEPFF